MPEKIMARRAAGKIGGLVKAKHKPLAVLEREAMKKHLDQRLMRVTDVMVNSQISLARGQQFLYKIKKTWVQTGKKDGDGYYKNEKPELVTAQYEIEMYLAELAENNGELSDDKDPGDTYYYITTKEPNMMAIADAHNRVHGKPRETVDLNQTVTFSLVDLAKKRDMIDGNAGLEVLDAPHN